MDGDSLMLGLGGKKNENQNQKFHVPHNHNHVINGCLFNQKLITLIMRHCGNKNGTGPGGMEILPYTKTNKQR